MKKVSLFLLALTITLLSVISCSKEENNDNTGYADGNYIYAKGSELTLVVPNGSLTDGNFSDVTYELSSITNYHTTDGSGEKTEHEIVFGKSNRAVSLEAYRLLGLQDRLSNEYLGYVIYSDGSSIAVAYDEPLYGLTIAEDAAIDTLVEQYIKGRSTLKLDNGHKQSVSFNAIEYQKARDEIYKEERWQSAKSILTSKCGAELAEKIIYTLKNYYNLTDTQKLVSWLADLYDASTGGFYYSNSGRNNEGFLPDLESTYQALSFLDSIGLSSWAGGIHNLLPDSMKQQMVKWVKGLQDSENGYFYHPQWGKETTDTALSRRGRDLQWAEHILNLFGAKPTYDTPNGIKGDGIVVGDNVAEPTSKLTHKLGSLSPVLAVSHVVWASDIDAGVAEHLKNDKSFIDYLNGLDIDKPDNSYSVGNTLESQATQIVARDKVLKERGESYSLVDILYDFLCEKQNKESGMWEVDGSTDYAANNGLMKIGSTILKIERPIPNADIAIKGAFKCITNDQVPTSVCDVFNSWVSLRQCVDSLEKYSYSNPAMAETAAEMRQRTLSEAPELIDATVQKFSLFAKEDGSFSYLKGMTSYTSQGLPVAVEGTNEGDMNATGIAISSTIWHIYSILGLRDGVPLCYASDMLIFRITLDNQGAIVKNVVDDEREFASGSYYKQWGGEPYSYYNATIMRNTYRYDAFITQNVDFDYYEDEEKTKYKQEFINIGYDEERYTSYLRYGKSKESGHYRGLFLKATNITGASVFVFETDFCIDTVSQAALETFSSVKGSYILSFELSQLIYLKAKDSYLNPIFNQIGRVYVFPDGEGGCYFRFGPALLPYMVNEDLLGPIIRLGEWGNIAIEVYNNGTSKYYCNNEYICETNIGVSAENFEKTNSIRFALSPDAVDSAVHIDFTFIGKLNKEFTEGNNKLDLDNFDFKAGEYYENFGGYAYNSQLYADSPTFFRNTSAATWGETLDFVHSTQGLIYYKNFNREGIAMVEKSDIKGQINKVLEYCKGSSSNFYNGIYYAKHTDATDGDVFVFETDFKLENISQNTLSSIGNGGTVFDISLSTSTDPTYTGTKTILAKIASVYLVKNTNGEYEWYFTNNRILYNAEENFGTPLSVNDWHTLTVEIYKNGVAKYYVDGKCVGDKLLDVEPEGFADAQYLRIALTESVKASSVLLDNTFFGKVDKKFVSDPTNGIPLPPERSDEKPFDNAPGSAVSGSGWS